MARYRVIFRACDRVAALNNKPRPFGLEKHGVIQACFSSLHQSLAAVPHRIHVVGDRLSDESVRFFDRLPVELTNGEFGAAGSLLRSFELACEADDDEWVYVCEDDYLHERETFRILDEFLENRAEYLGYDPRPRWGRMLTGPIESRDLFVFLADYPDRYRPKYRRPSLIFRSQLSHWRQVDRTTFSFLSLAEPLRRRRRALSAIARRIDDRRLSRLLYGGLFLRGRGLCVSPLPGLATHLHEGVMTPLVDWTRRLQEISSDGSGLPSVSPDRPADAPSQAARPPGSRGP